MFIYNGFNLVKSLIDSVEAELYEPELCSGAVFRFIRAYEKCSLRVGCIDNFIIKSNHHMRSFKALCICVLDPLGIPHNSYCFDDCKDFNYD